MIDKSLLDPEKRPDSQVAEMAEMTVIDAMKICAVELQHGAVRSTVSMAICSVRGDALDEGSGAGHM